MSFSLALMFGWFSVGEFGYGWRPRFMACAVSRNAWSGRVREKETDFYITMIWNDTSFPPHSLSPRNVLWPQKRERDDRYRNSVERLNLYVSHTCSFENLEALDWKILGVREGELGYRIGWISVIGWEGSIGAWYSLGWGSVVVFGPVR